MKPLESETIHKNYVFHFTLSRNLNKVFSVFNQVRVLGWTRDVLIEILNLSFKKFLSGIPQKFLWCGLSLHCDVRTNALWFLCTPHLVANSLLGCLHSQAKYATPAWSSSRGGILYIRALLLAIDTCHSWVLHFEVLYSFRFWDC